ncbi:MAG: TRC40/GET3/ArsA family transport-energizing ATPase [Halobacteriales archaeon]|nr:TRC40/GET3/ArsA family transport-energizing ATPase [Halobacteriales archaeon]
MVEEGETTRYVLYGGKGGVGKTTCAAGTAYRLAEEGHETLVISTDPAHSLSDSFDAPVSSEPTEIRDGLWAVEVDPEEAMEEYRDAFEEVPKKLAGGIGASMGLDTDEVDEGMGGLFDDAMNAPGSDEAVAMFKFMEYMESDRWDYIVFDTAPTGHTLKLLQLPEVMDSMVGRFMRIRSQVQNAFGSFMDVFGGDSDDETTHDKLERMSDRIESVRSKLVDPEQTEFRVVLVPESMAVLETQRLLERLSRFGVPVRTVVVNKVMEDVNEDCGFCLDRWEVQQKNLKEVEEKFGDLRIVRLPLCARRYVAPRLLRRSAKELGAAGSTA